MAKRPAEVKAEKVTKVQVERSAGLLCDVKAFAPKDVVAYMLVWKKEETHGTTP